MWTKFPAMLELNFAPFPVLESDRLRLVQFEERHLEAMFLLRTSDDVMRFVERPRPENIEEVREMLMNNKELAEKKEGIVWVVELKEEQILAGTIGFWRMKKEHHRAEIGYMILPQYWKQGIMSEALREVLRYGFDVMRLHSIEADINPENSASATILERNGFSREAFFKENFYWKGKYLNSAIYSLLVQDYKSSLK